MNLKPMRYLRNSVFVIFSFICLSCKTSEVPKEVYLADLGLTANFWEEDFTSVLDTVSDNSSQSKVVWELKDVDGREVRLSYDRKEINRNCETTDNDQVRDDFRNVIRIVFDEKCKPHEELLMLGEREFLFFKCSNIVLAYACINSYDVTLEFENFSPGVDYSKVLLLK